MKKFSICVTAVICLLFYSRNYCALADEPQLAAAVDKQNAHVNEEIHLSVKITGVRGNFQAPKLPALESFEIFYSGRASHFSFINGQTESLTEFDYVLIPRSAGRFVLRPIEVTIDGKAYQTPQLEINVEDGQTVAPQQVPRQAPMVLRNSGSSQTTPVSNAQPQAPSPPEMSGNDSRIFLRVVPSKLTLYTNEQLLLIYSLYTQLDTRYEGFEEEPETSGFWIEEFPMDQDLGRDTELVDGRKYVRADIKKLALFPTAPGEYLIKPGMIKASVQIQENNSSMFDEFFNDSFFGGAGLFARRVEKRMTHPPIKIEVKPLPDVKTKSVAGSVPGTLAHRGLSIAS